MSKRNQHVVPHKEGWAVRTAGRSKAGSVHGRDGQIRERSTYGDDPFPPEG